MRQEEYVSRTMIKLLEFVWFFTHDKTKSNLS